MWERLAGDKTRESTYYNGPVYQVKESKHDENYEDQPKVLSRGVT